MKSILGEISESDPAARSRTCARRSAVERGSLPGLALLLLTVGPAVLLGSSCRRSERPTPIEPPHRIDAHATIPELLGALGLDVPVSEIPKRIPGATLVSVDPSVDRFARERG